MRVPIRDALPIGPTKNNSELSSKSRVFFFISCRGNPEIDVNKIKRLVIKLGLDEIACWPFFVIFR